MTQKQIVRRPFPTSISRSVATPIYPSVVYASQTPDELDSQYEGAVHGYTYSREGHPNAQALAAHIDALEGCEGGFVTGSGMAAVSVVLLGLAQSGDHILGGNQLYGRSLRLMMQDLPRYGIETSLADPTDAQAFAAAIQPNTKLILLEVVSNPTLRVADMDGILQIARDRGIPVAIDNTFTTPLGYQPFAAGADIVIHSITKLLAGHSDAMLGWFCAKDPAVQADLVARAVTLGLTPSPFDCWLAERGLYTFDMRFARAQENARLLADRLAGLPGVTRVLYPGRPDHPDHNRAAHLLGDAPGNMVSFEVTGGRAAANALTQAAEALNFAPTLGDVGTTLSHPASSSHRALTPEARAELGMSEGFFRVSVGVEDGAWLADQFEQAVAAAVQAGG